MELQLPVSHPYSNVSGVSPTPTNLAVAQIGINTADGKMWTKDPEGNIVPLGGVSIPLVTVSETTASASLTATSKDVPQLEIGKALYLLAPFNNVANTTLDVNGLGAKPIYFKGSAITEDIIVSNTPTLLVYETTSLASGCWRVVSDIYVDEKQWDEVAQTIDSILNGTVEVTANSANKLTTARTIELTGDATGSTSFDGSENVSINTTITGKIAVTGDRGTLAGYETVGTASTISETSPDSNEVGQDVTISNGTVGTSWTKIARLTAAVNITLSSSWVWSDGSVPTITAGGILVCCWCGSGGIAQFISPA